jgi:hypothetical protein
MSESTIQILHVEMSGFRRWNCIVSAVTSLQSGDGVGFDPLQGQEMFLFFNVSELAPGPTQFTGFFHWD